MGISVVKKDQFTRNIQRRSTLTSLLEVSVNQAGLVKVYHQNSYRICLATEKSSGSIFANISGVLRKNGNYSNKILAGKHGLGGLSPGLLLSTFFFEETD